MRAWPAFGVREQGYQARVVGNADSSQQLTLPVWSVPIVRAAGPKHPSYWAQVTGSSMRMRRPTTLPLQLNSPNKKSGAGQRRSHDASCHRCPHMRAQIPRSRSTATPRHSTALTSAPPRHTPRHDRPPRNRPSMVSAHATLRPHVLVSAHATTHATANRTTNQGLTRRIVRQDNRMPPSTQSYLKYQQRIAIPQYVTSEKTIRFIWRTEFSYKVSKRSNSLNIMVVLPRSWNWLTETATI